MSLFSIVKTVMDSNGWPAPVTSVAASQDQNMRQSFALANKMLKVVSWKKDWPQLVKFHQIDLIPGQQDYDGPGDVHHIVSPAAFNLDDYYYLAGNLTPMQLVRYMSDGSSNYKSGFYLRYAARRVSVFPIPQSAKTIVYAYVTTQIVHDADGNPKTEYSQDNDVALVDEDVVELGLSWRWRQKKGLDYTTEIAEFNNVLRERFAQYLALGEIPVGCAPPGAAPLTNGYIGPGPIGV